MAENEQGLGPGGLPEQERLETLPQEETLRRQAAYGEGRRFFEILRTAENPQAITWAMRNIAASAEKQKTVESPNRFTRDSVFEMHTDRAQVGRLRLEGQIMEDWSVNKLVYGAIFAREKRGVSAEEVIGTEKLSKEQLKVLIDTFEENQEEFWARWRILESFRQHRMASMDLETVTVKAFTWLSKVYPEAGYWKTVGNAKETLPGAERFGVMLDKALRGWCDIGENKVAGVTNIFDKKRHESTYEKALDHVAERALGRRVTEEEKKYSLHWQDAKDAARFALEPFRLFDLDVKYDLKNKSVTPKKDETLERAGTAEERKEIEEEIKGEREKWRRSLKAFFLNLPDPAEGDWDFEASTNSGDLAKTAHFILRQIKEYCRNNPRAVGAPAVVGCFPNLTVDYMRMTTITAFKNKGIERGIEDNVFANLWTLWREKKIPFGDLPWGEKVWADGARKLIIKGILPSDAKEDEWEVSGISQDSYDVPFTLQHFYAVGTVFNEITRKDLSKAFEEIQIPDYLQGKNKGWENTFSFLNRGLGLEEETMEKIRQLAKINFLIGVTAANIGSKKEIGKDYEAVAGKTLKPASEVRRMNMAAGAGRKEEREGTKVDNIVYAAKQGGFFSTTEPSQRERLRREENLFRKGVNRRRGFLPSEAKGWFDKDELEAIKKSGLYAPYNKV